MELIDNAHPDSLFMVGSRCAAEASGHRLSMVFGWT